jgi:hypothetical protein
LTKFRILATIIFLAAVLTLGLPLFAEAQLPPALYRCTVYEDGVLVGANYNVTAYVGSEIAPRVWNLTSSYGVAILVVPVTEAEINSTEPISFKVDGALATETPEVSVTMEAPEVRLDVYTGTPTPGEGGLSGGAIAGIVIGSLIALGLIMWFIIRRRG